MAAPDLGKGRLERIGVGEASSRSSAIARAMTPARPGGASGRSFAIAGGEAWTISLNSSARFVDQNGRRPVVSSLRASALERKQTQARCLAYPVRGVGALPERRAPASTP